LGAHYRIGSINVGGGLGTGLTNGYGAPRFRGLALVEYAPEIILDSDGDGIPDKQDACPTVKGVPNDDPSKHGCPPEAPKDRDRDGILDQDDACPDVPGVATSDPKTNGCPAPGDRDKDGILDKDDACPDDPGKANEDKSLHGCPDTDGDGVFDKVDACPTEPGLKTTDPKTNGCPDNDRDKDGIANKDDACPDEPGAPDPDPKKNGCPKAVVKDGQILILDQVKFKTGSADILPGKDSEEILLAVKNVLTEHPEIAKLRVEGHTDNKGNAAMNKKLSADRAASVVKWLTKNGIAKERLGSAGFGQDKPIDTNNTDDGRKNNRRVEFHIEK
jgi:outer membrane protein OmpA-like peptidoglycan-associated protein